MRARFASVLLAGVTYSAVCYGSACYPSGPPSVITNWNDPGNWSNTPGGTPGTCPAGGGITVSFKGNYQFLPKGVPGASASYDTVSIPSGYVVHVNVPVQLGIADLSGNGTAITVAGTSLSSYGAVVVDDGASLSLSGYASAASSNAGAANLQRYGVLQVMPGGWLFVDTGSNLIGEFTVGGRLYIGCGDTTAAASPFCATNAGAWVQAVPGSPGYLTGSSLPPLNVGDLVELTPIPQPVQTGNGAYGPPYTSIGNIPPTPAAAPPEMPLTDRGLMPDGWPLCVAQVNPLVLAIPSSPSYSCTGATVLNLQDAGKGLFWLKKPAFVWGDPSQYGWNNQTSINISALSWAFGGSDALRSWVALPGGYSNAQGTGPGWAGSSSFVPVSLQVSSANGYVCSMIATRQPRFEDLATCGDYFLDDVSGQFAVWGGGATVNLIANARVALPFNADRSVTFQTPPGGPFEGNEWLIENADIRYLYGSRTPIFAAANYSSAMNGAHFRFEGNTTRNAGGLIQTSGLAGTASNPIPINNNAWYDSPETGTYMVASNVSSSFVDISNNYWNTKNDNIVTYNLTGVQDNPHWSITNNVGNILCLMDTTTVAAGEKNTFSDLLFQRNRLMNMGFPIQGVYAGSWQGPAGLPGHPAHLEWNYLYGMARCGFIDQYTKTDHNLCAWAIHHGWVLNPSNQQGAGYFPGVDFEYNLNVERQATGGSDGFLDLGYNMASWVDAPIVRNNTSTGNSEGGISLGDAGDGGVIGLVSNATITDNLLVGSTAVNLATYTSGYGFSKTLSSSGENINQSSILQAGNNILAGPGPPYAGAVGAGAPNMTNLSFNRFIKVTHNGGTLYNSDPARNLTGVMIQNPTYSSLSGASLQLTYNSPADISVAWNDGTGFGAPAELNLAGAGTAFPITGASGQSVFAQLSIAGNWGGGDWAVGCPQSNWLKIVGGPGAGHVYAIMHCAAGQLTVAPDATADGVTSGSTAVLMPTETRLYNSAGTNYVDIGIDPRTLATASGLDSGIALALTDYCNSGCASFIDPQIPGSEVNTVNSFIWQKTQSPVFPIAPPMQGGSMELAWTGTTYRPSAAAATASSTGGCVGAVSCDGQYGSPQSISFGVPANAVFGSAPVPLNATTSSGLPVSLSSTTPSVCSVVGSSAAILTAGTCTVAANQAGGSGFLSAAQVVQSFTISPAPTTVTWAQPAAIAYGSALSASQLNATGSVPGTMVYNPPAGTVLPTGNGQTLKAVFTPSDSLDYSGSTGSVTINVNPPAAPGSSASLVLTRTLSRNAGQNIVAVVTIANIGKGDAVNTTVTVAMIGAVSATPLPDVLGTIKAGSAVQTTLTFPPSAGTSGTAASLIMAGTFTGGTFSNSSRVTLP